jgi:putative transposase
VGESAPRSACARSDAAGCYVTDGHDGLLAAVQELFPATPRQRCLVHKQRNVLNAVPRRVRQQVETELVGIWAQPTKEGALTQLAAFKAKYGRLYPEAVQSLAEEEDKTMTFYDFPKVMQRSIRTTNAIESLFSNVWQWTGQIDAFTTEMSYLTIVWATIEGINLRKVPVE